MSDCQSSALRCACVCPAASACHLTHMFRLAADACHSAHCVARVFVRRPTPANLPTLLHTSSSGGRCLSSYAHCSSGSLFWCALVRPATVGTEAIAGTYFKSFNLEQLCSVCRRPHIFGWRLVGMAKRSRSRRQQHKVAVAFERRGRACFKANTLRVLRRKRRPAPQAASISEPNVHEMFLDPADAAHGQI